MPLTFGRQDHRLKQIAAKAAYVEMARKKLAKSRAQLDSIRAVLRSEVARGMVDANDQLDLAQRAAEADLARTEARLACLRKSGEDNWSALRIAVEDSWEDLSRSMRNLLKRISDEN